jgi:hypothetical protein
MKIVLKMKSQYEVLRSVRGSAIPSARTIASKVDKARRNERREFKQNRRMIENV